MLRAAPAATSSKATPSDEPTPAGVPVNRRATKVSNPALKSKPPSTITDPAEDPDHDYSAGRRHLHPERDLYESDPARDQPQNQSAEPDFKHEDASPRIVPLSRTPAVCRSRAAAGWRPYSSSSGS